MAPGPTDDFPIEEPGSPTPGSPRTTPANSPSASASTPSTSSPSSSTTGPPSPETPAASSTGIAPSGTAAASSPIGGWVNGNLVPFRLPEATARSMTASLVGHVKTTIEPVVGPDGQYEPGKVSVTWVGGWGTKMPQLDAQRDLATLAPCLRQSSKVAVAPIVAVLKARTKSKTSDPREAEFEARVVGQDLCAYPIDVVQDACEYWVTLEEQGKWFPAWAELRAICERRVQPRRALEKALRWVADGAPRNDGAPDAPPNLQPAPRPSLDPRPAAMLERNGRISRRRVGMVGAAPDNLEVWWSQILEAAKAEGLDAGTIEDWKGPNADARPQRPVGARIPRPPYSPPQNPSARRAAELSRAKRTPPPDGEAP